MKVHDFMIQDVISVKPDTTVRELLTLFINHRIGGVPVLDSNQHLVGMVSDGDVLRYLSPKPEAVHDLFYTVYVQEAEKEQDVLNRKMNKTVADMMHKRHLYTVHQDDEIEVAIRLLSQHHFKKLPVINSNKKVIGVISRGDVIYNLSKMIISK